MPEPKEPGQTAFEAFHAQLSNDPSGWNGCPPYVKRAWAAVEKTGGG